MDLGSVTNYAWLTAGLATVGMLWGHVNSVFNRFRSFFVISCTIDGDAAAGFFLYCRTKLKSSKFDKKNYNSNSMHVKSLRKYRQVGIEQFGDFLTFFDGWKPLFVNYKRDDANGTSTMTISCVRGMFDIENIIVEGLAMMDKLNSQDSGTSRYAINRHFGSLGGKEMHPHNSDDDATPEPPSRILARGYRILGWDVNDLGLDCEKKPFDALFYDQKILDFIGVAKHWLDSKEFYVSHRIPWRLGAAFYGPPGTGKTSLVRALAQYLDLPVEIFDLPSMSNEELTRKWSRVLNRTPCIVLFEDLDRIFEGQNIKGGSIQKPTVTLDCLLNCMSGIEAANGIFVVVTANDITKLDEALGIPDENDVSSRPGRLDYAFHLGVLDRQCREQMANLLLADHAHLIPQVIEDGEGETGAQFQKRCGDIALRLYWKDFKTKAAPAAAPSGVHKSANNPESAAHRPSRRSALIEWGGAEDDLN